MDLDSITGTAKKDLDMVIAPGKRLGAKAKTKSRLIVAGFGISGLIAYVLLAVWKKKVLNPIPQNYTLNELANIAVQIQNVDAAKKVIPASVTLADRNITLPIADYFYLILKAVVNINSKNLNSIALTKNYKLSSGEVDQMLATTITQANYVSLAGKLVTSMDSNGVTVPSYQYATNVKIGWHNMFYMYNLAMATWKAKGSLPASISVKPWSS